MINEICRIINEEQKINNHIEILVKDFKDSKNREMAYAALNEELAYSFSENITLMEALLYPCIRILKNKDIPIQSGLQYETVIKLGILQDVRSTDALLDALNRINLQHVNLIVALIYAVGNLKRKEAIGKLKEFLSFPDCIFVDSISMQSKYKISLHRIKAEAVLALGKLGIDSLEVLQDICNLVSINDNETKLYLAWALGKIGKVQLDKYGVVSSEIIGTLIKLLNDENVKVYEEAVYAIKNIGLNEFLNILQLPTIGALSVLALKPSSLGLAELSETLMYLMSLKHPVVMAITGDSGTGKTYFCESIMNGFGLLSANDILYLARDKPEHNKIFNRVLGLKWLKKYVSPQYYSDYTLTENDDNPEEYFIQFIKENSDKKLIILDGWRDFGYFHQIIQIFYENGYLDIIVKFQASYSTKRLNLEKREKILDNVRICLSNIEDPVIEETPIYREGRVLLYYLDNSELSRLNKEETLEIFGRVKVKSWGDYIRIGEFIHDIVSLTAKEDCISIYEEPISFLEDDFKFSNYASINIEKAKFSRQLNDDLNTEPNLLQTINLKEYNLNRLSFYLPGRVVYGSYDGTIGILSSMYDTIFKTKVHNNKIVFLNNIGEDILSLDIEGVIKRTSFTNKMALHIKSPEDKICSFTTDKRNKLIIGTINGLIYIRFLFK